MQDIVDKFILLGNKAKVLLKVQSDLEPRVNILVNSKGEITYTFNSTCFPFFSENGFETVSGDEVKLFLEKCSLFVQNLENNIKLEFEQKPEETKLLGNRFNGKYSRRNNWSSFLFETKKFKRRINISAPDSINENPLCGAIKYKDPHNQAVKITVEEFDK